MPQAAGSFGGGFTPTDGHAWIPVERHGPGSSRIHVAGVKAILAAAAAQGVAINISLWSFDMLQGSSETISRRPPRTI